MNTSAKKPLSPGRLGTFFSLPWREHYQSKSLWSWLETYSSRWLSWGWAGILLFMVDELEGRDLMNNRWPPIASQCSDLSWNGCESCGHMHVRGRDKTRPSGALTQVTCPANLDLDTRAIQLGQQGFQKLLQGAHSRKGLKFKFSARFWSII